MNGIADSRTTWRSVVWLTLLVSGGVVSGVGCDSGSSEEQKQEARAVLKKATAVASKLESIVEAYHAEDRDASAVADGWTVDDFGDAKSFRASANERGASSFDVVTVGVKGGFPEKGAEGGTEVTGAKMSMQIATVDDGPKLVGMGVTNRISGVKPVGNIPDGASAFRSLGSSIEEATRDQGVCLGFPIASSSELKRWLPGGAIRRGLLDQLEYASERKKQHCNFVASMEEADRRFQFGFDKALLVARSDADERVGHALVKNQFGSYMTLELPDRLKGG